MLTAQVFHYLNVAFLVRLRSSRTWGQQVSETKMWSSWTTAGSQKVPDWWWESRNLNSFEISGEDGENSLTSVFGKFDFHSLSLSLFAASSFRGNLRSFFAQQGSRQNDNNRTQQAGLVDSVRSSFHSSPLSHRLACNGNGSLHPSSGLYLADKFFIGVSQRRQTDTKIILHDSIRLSAADQLQPFLLSLLRLNLQLSGCQPWNPSRRKKFYGWNF